MFCEAPSITDPPPTRSTTLSKKKKITHDMWHMTHEMWRGTLDMWHVTRSGRWKFSLNFMSLALTVWKWRCFYLEEKDDWVHEGMNDEGVCRTAGSVNKWDIVMQWKLAYSRRKWWAVQPLDQRPVTGSISQSQLWMDLSEIMRPYCQTGGRIGRPNLKLNNYE